MYIPSKTITYKNLQYIVNAISALIISFIAKKKIN